MDGKRPGTGVRFEPLLADDADGLDQPSPKGTVEAAVMKANTSFLPAIAPKPTKMSSIMRKRAAEAEIAFLNELYRTTGGPGWTRKENWGEGMDFDSWAGVSGVDVGFKSDKKNYQRCVSELVLGGNGLNGSLPPSFFWQGVPHISVVECPFNPGLGGPLPALPSTNCRLVVLDCRNCRLEGPLPSAMPPLLQRLLLSDNRLEGVIPHTWGLSKLRQLHLARNRLTGVGGRAGVLAGMPELEVVDCQANLIKANYSELWGHALPPNLTLLDLSHNHLRGAVGSATWTAASLEVLNLQANGLVGPVSEEVGSLTNLRDLRLGDNKLTGPFPREVTKLGRLKTLSAPRNDLEGPLDEIRWGALSATLVHLDLSCNGRLGGRLEAKRSPNETDTSKAMVRRQRLAEDPYAPSSDDSDAEAEAKARREARLSLVEQEERAEERRLRGADSDSDEGEEADGGTNPFAGKEVAVPDVGEGEGRSGANSKADLKLRRVGALRKLVHLDLRECGVEGPVPKHLARTLVHLKLLCLDGNRLTGRLPRLQRPRPPTPPASPTRTRAGGGGSKRGRGAQGTGGAGAAQGFEDEDSYDSEDSGSSLGSDDGLVGGLRALTQCGEVGLSRNALTGSLSEAVWAMPRQSLRAVRLQKNKLDERRPKIRNSHFADALAPAVVRLCGSLRSLEAHGNDLGRGPRGCGEKGVDSDEDEEGDSDGEGGVVSPRTLEAMARARAQARARVKRDTASSALEDAFGRPMDLSAGELERALVRQRYAVHHTVTVTLAAVEKEKAQRRSHEGRLGEEGGGGGGRDGDNPPHSAQALVLRLDPPLTTALRPKGKEDADVVRPSGQLARLRFDLNQVLRGLEENIPDYSAPPAPESRANVATDAAGGNAANAAAEEVEESAVMDDDDGGGTDGDVDEAEAANRRALRSAHRAKAAYDTQQAKRRPPKPPMAWKYRAFKYESQRAHWDF